jgi:hypothetical protein
MKNLISTLMVLVLLGSCDTDEPEAENVEEIITRVTLTFSPTSGGDAVVVTATDPDGEGSQGLVIDGTISLENNFQYELSLKFENTWESPAENITEEVEEEGDEHLILFGWSGDVFSNPVNGDITGNRYVIRYEDADDNGQPIGLTTLWTTAATTASGTFRAVLKHQPDGIKTSTSGISDGATDVDLTFDIEVGK